MRLSWKLWCAGQASMRNSVISMTRSYQWPRAKYNAYAMTGACPLGSWALYNPRFFEYYTKDCSEHQCFLTASQAEEADQLALREVFGFCYSGASLDEALSTIAVDRDMLQLLMPRQADSEWTAWTWDVRGAHKFVRVAEAERGYSCFVYENREPLVSRRMLLFRSTFPKTPPALFWTELGACLVSQARGACGTCGATTTVPSVWAGHFMRACKFAAVFVFVAKDRKNIPSMPHSLWLALVTMTTVGYGDYYPTSLAGRLQSKSKGLHVEGVVLISPSICQLKLRRLSMLEINICIDLHR